MTQIGLDLRATSSPGGCPDRLDQLEELIRGAQSAPDGEACLRMMSEAERLLASCAARLDVLRRFYLRTRKARCGG